MTTFTVLISIPDNEAPTLSDDLADTLTRLLETNERYSVAHVDVRRGVLIKNNTNMGKYLINFHRAVAAESFKE